jgi:hypothetical protein
MIKHGFKNPAGRTRATYPIRRWALGSWRAASDLVA